MYTKWGYSRYTHDNHDNTMTTKTTIMDKAIGYYHWIDLWKASINSIPLQLETLRQQSTGWRTRNNSMITKSPRKNTLLIRSSLMNRVPIYQLIFQRSVHAYAPSQKAYRRSPVGLLPGWIVTSSWVTPSQVTPIHWEPHANHRMRCIIECCG